MCFSLTTTAQTTWEEYHFVTEGYELQESLGMDTEKKGYYMVPFAQPDLPPPFDQEEIIFERLLHYKHGMKAIILKRKKNGNTWKMLCIPHPASEPEMIDLFYTDFTEEFKGRKDISLLFYIALNMMQLYEFPE